MSKNIKTTIKSDAENADLKLRLKQAEDALAFHAFEKITSGRSHLRTLIDNLPDYIYFKDINHRFIDANKATVRVMKCSSFEDLIGKTDFDFYPKEFAKKYWNHEEDIFKTGKSKMNIEETVIDELGQLRTLSTSKVVLKDKVGKVIGLVGIGRDITEQKNAEEVLKRDKDTLAQLVEDRTVKLMEMQSAFDRAQQLSEVGKLTAIVAHELRNPMTAINLAICNLKRKFKDEEMQTYFNAIEKKIVEGEQIISNLLFYSRLKKPHYEIVNMVEVLQECIDVAKMRARKAVIFEMNLPSIKDLELEADPLQIKEVFFNLINNAYDAVPADEGRIEISARVQGKNIDFYVNDNGPGIYKEDLAKIFEPFFTTKSKGTGLGLTVCKQIIDMHQGMIDIRSAPGKGTRITVSLPRKK